jgi:FkbM family methyltransferase
MGVTLIETAAQLVGHLRLGRRPLPGRGRAVNALGHLAGWVSGGRAIVSPWPGVRFEVDLTDRIQRQMWAGVYEPHVRECFHALLRPGDVFIDVGAHIGYHAVFAAHRVGGMGRVFAFEAEPEMHQRLARNLAQFSWAQAVHAAVWDHSDTLSFERSSVVQESGWGTLCAVRDLARGEHLDVEAVALDDWCRDNRVTRCDAMKLDAEGSELAVLRGAQGLLERFRPCLILEINGVLLTHAGGSAKQVRDFILGRGYRLFQLSIRRLDAWDLANDAACSEALCVPEERTADVLGHLARLGFQQAGEIEERSAGQ